MALSLCWFVLPVSRYDTGWDGWAGAFSYGNGAPTTLIAVSGLLWALILCFSTPFVARLILVALSVWSSTYTSGAILWISGACFFGECPALHPAYYIAWAGLIGVWGLAAAELLRLFISWRSQSGIAKSR